MVMFTFSAGKADPYPQYMSIAVRINLCPVHVGESSAINMSPGGYLPSGAISGDQCWFQLLTDQSHLAGHF